MFPVHIMPKPAGAMCNLNCTYCYYLEKQKLYPEHLRQEMSEKVLEEYIRQYISIQPADEVLFTWHGGEPLLRPITFYEKAMQMQQRFAQGKRISNAIQTNGTLLTKDWCKYLADNDFLVGISIDGSAEMHDKYRLSRSGRGSWRQVMNGIEMLEKHGVEWNAMAVINAHNVQQPKEFYRFFRSIGCTYLQFTPIVERFYKHTDGRLLASPIEGHTTAELAPFSVQAKQWGDFLCGVFDEWISEDVGKMFIQIFENTLANWMGMQGNLCTMAATCGHATAIEHNGDVYACDHYVFPEFKLGNILHNNLVEMLYSEAQVEFGSNKRKLLTQQCRECEFRFACNGDCPRTRFSRSQDGEQGHPFLCEGWQQFFQHVSPAMDYMKQKLLHNESPASVMEYWRNREKK